MFTPCLPFDPSTVFSESCSVLDAGLSSDLCQIPPMVWSGSSKNNVPVARSHPTRVWDESKEYALSTRYLQEAQKEAMCALNVLGEYVNENLEVELFSGEGDSLHQMFDCMVQGPYARMDLWSRGSRSELPVPHWARDTNGAGVSRKMDMPCTGSKLGGDFKPPFTCGGSTRKAVIKYFVRDHVNKNNEGVTLTEQLIREQIERLKEVWSKDISEFKCEGSDGGKSFDNCYMGNKSAFLPAVLDVSFDAVPGSNILRGIIEEVWPYLQEALVSAQTPNPTPASPQTLNPSPQAGGNGNREFTQENSDVGEMSSWNWVEMGLGHIARDDGLYDSQKGIVNYSAGETGYPFANGSSIWDMCTGMVSQVMFTMPMTPITIDDHVSWTVTSILGLRTDALRFEPTRQASGEGDGLSMLEEYVEKLLEDSFSDSPTFWHYAVRHVPSNSQICESVADESPAAFDETTLDFVNTNWNLSLPTSSMPLFGYHAFPLGGVDTSCVCGWNKNAGGMCVVPGSTTEYDPLTEEGKASARELVRTWNSEDGESSCPENDLSDAWGVVPDVLVDNWIARTGGEQRDVEAEVSDILSFGMAGLRVGNLNTLGMDARRQGVHPGTRVHPLQSADGTGSVSLKNCEQDILKLFDASSVVEDVVNDLFPMAQGIHDSAAVSSCLRFSIEYSRLRVMYMISSNGLRDLKLSIDVQDTVVAVWRTRYTHTHKHSEDDEIHSAWLRRTVSYAAYSNEYATASRR
jgi:hypothetical protein